MSKSSGKRTRRVFNAEFKAKVALAALREDKTLADRLGNVAEASRLSGVSRDTIYRHRRLLKAGGTEALRRQEAQGYRHKN